MANKLGTFWILSSSPSRLGAPRSAQGWHWTAGGSAGPSDRRNSGRCTQGPSSCGGRVALSTQLGREKSLTTAARRSAPRPAAPIRPGPQSARARLSGGAGAARDALRPLAPPQGARHPPAAAPRAACPLFWSRGPAAPPLTASERGVGQSARPPARAPPRAPPPPRVPSPRAPRPGAGPARTRPGWAGAHVPRGAPRSHWPAGRARPRSQPMRVEGPGGGAPRGGAGPGAGSKRIAVRTRGLSRTWVFIPRSSPSGFPRGGEPAGHSVSVRLGWLMDVRATTSGAEAGRMGWPCAGLRLPWPDHSQTRFPEYGVLRARPLHPPRTLQATLPENLCIWLSAPEPPDRIRQEAPSSRWLSRPPRQPISSSCPHPIPLRLSSHYFVGPAAFHYRLFLKLHNFFKTTVLRSQCI